MRNLLPGLIVGILFGAGLALSDMVNPARVLAFLDVAGAWDPTLLYVMSAALLPSAVAYLIRRRIPKPLLAESFAIPRGGTLDRPLLLGAAMFGVGWGLVGFCPGPAIAGLVFGVWQPWLFVAAMLTAMALHHLLVSARAEPRQSEG